MSDKKLTKRQKNILRYIYDCLREDSRPPTIREIGTALDISSTSVVNYNLNRLQEKDLLEREATVSRGLRLTDAAFELLNVKPAPAVPRPSTSPSILESLQNLVRIPVLGNIVAGEPIEVGNDAFTTYDEDDAIEFSATMLPGRTNDLFALRVSGDSMVDDMINDGDIVVMRPQQTIAQDGEMVAAWVTGEGNTLKRIYRENNRIRLQPSNPNMGPIYADPNDVAVQGKVILVLRNTA